MNTSQEKKIMQLINGEMITPVVMQVMKEKEPGYQKSNDKILCWLSSISTSKSSLY
jgi:hypothetical protein